MTLEPEANTKLHQDGPGSKRAGEGEGRSSGRLMQSKSYLKFTYAVSDDFKQLFCHIAVLGCARPELVHFHIFRWGQVSKLRAAASAAKQTKTSRGSPGSDQRW